MLYSGQLLTVIKYDGNTAIFHQYKDIGTFMQSSQEIAVSANSTVSTQVSILDVCLTRFRSVSRCRWLQPQGNIHVCCLEEWGSPERRHQTHHPQAQEVR